jgi:glucosamine-6-phosphate deaminase
MNGRAVRVFDSASAVASGVADAVARIVRDNPAARLALPTGRKPIAAYEELRRRHRAGHLSFSRASFFQVDEFVGVSPRHRGSFATYLQRHLFDGLDFDPSRIHLLNGNATDLAGECERYERAIDAAGGLDVVVLGIGTNGHVAFNEPGDTLLASTHVASLLPSTRRDNAALFDGNADLVPRQALTVGIGTVLRAARVVLMATGSAKAECVKSALNGKVTTRVPASMLQLHRAVDVYLDRGAASLLRVPAVADRA